MKYRKSSAILLLGTVSMSSMISMVGCSSEGTTPDAQDSQSMASTGAAQPSSPSSGSPFAGLALGPFSASLSCADEHPPGSHTAPGQYTYRGEVKDGVLIVTRTSKSVGYAPPSESEWTETTTLDPKTGRIEERATSSGSSWGRPRAPETSTRSWKAPHEGGSLLVYVSQIVRLGQLASIAASGDPYCKVPRPLPANSAAAPIVATLENGLRSLTHLFASLEPRTFRLNGGCAGGPAEAPPIEITVSAGRLVANTNPKDPLGYRYALGGDEEKSIVRSSNDSSQYRGSHADFPRGDESNAQYLRLMDGFRDLIQTVAKGNACTPAESVKDLQEALALLDSFRKEANASARKGTLFSDRQRIFSNSTNAACDFESQRVVWVSKDQVRVEYHDGWNLIYEVAIDRATGNLSGYAVEHGPGSYAPFQVKTPQQGGDRTAYERWRGEAKKTTETVRDGTSCNGPVPELDEVVQYIDSLGR